MCLSPSLVSPTIKVLRAIKVLIESSSLLDNVASLSATIWGLVTIMVSLLLHEDYNCTAAYRDVSVCLRAVRTIERLHVSLNPWMSSPSLQTTPQWGYGAGGQCCLDVMMASMFS